MRVKEVSEAGGKQRGQAAETSSSQPPPVPSPHSLPPASVALTNPQQEENVAPRPPEPRRRFQEEVLPRRHLPRVPVPPVSVQLQDDLSTSSRASFTASDAPAAASLRRGLVQVVTVLRFSSPEKDPLHSLPRPSGPHRRSGPIGSPRAGTGVLWR